MLEKTAERQKLQWEAQKQPCAGRANAAKATVCGGTAKSVCCQERPCAMKTATSGRVLEDCAKATVAEGDRVRKVAGEANAGESDRVRQKLLQAAVCQKTAKCDCCRKRPCAKGCEKGERHVRKTVKEAKASKSDRMRRKSCARRLRKGESCDEQPCAGRLRKANAVQSGRVREYYIMASAAKSYRVERDCKSERCQQWLCAERLRKANGAQQRS